MWKTENSDSICLIIISEEERKWEEATFKEIMTDSSQGLIKSITFHIHEVI